LLSIVAPHQALQKNIKDVFSLPQFFTKLYKKFVILLQASQNQNTNSDFFFVIAPHHAPKNKNTIFHYQYYSSPRFKKIHVNLSFLTKIEENIYCKALLYFKTLQKKKQTFYYKFS
jgi:hypothetical protein